MQSRVYAAYLNLVREKISSKSPNPVGTAGTLIDSVRDVFFFNFNFGFAKYTHILRPVLSIINSLYLREVKLLWI